MKHPYRPIGPFRRIGNGLLEPPPVHLPVSKPGEAPPPTFCSIRWRRHPPHLYGTPTLIPPEQRVPKTREQVWAELEEHVPELVAAGRKRARSADLRKRWQQIVDARRRNGRKLAEPVPLPYSAPYDQPCPLCAADIGQVCLRKRSRNPDRAFAPHRERRLASQLGRALTLEEARAELDRRAGQLPP